MFGKVIVVVSLVGAVVANSLSTPTLAKRPLSISQRQVILMKRINRAERTNELTFKEANRLRDDLQSLIDREERMKEKNGGRLTWDNIGTVEKDLNKISVKIQKWQLEKRIAAK